MPPQQQGTATVAPPPTDQPIGQPNLDIGGAGDGGQMDHFRSIISRLSGGGTPAIDKALAQHHARTEAEAQGYAESAKRYYGMAAKARHTGVNPLTGQPATPQEINQWQQQADAMWGNYTKIAGKSKEAKPIIQQVGGLIRHITGHPGAAGGDKGAGTSGGGGSSQGGQQMSAGQAPTQQGSQTVPAPPQAQASPQSTVPPVPGAGMNPLRMSAEGSSMDALEKEQDTRRIKDEEYRDKLMADSDPRYHVNEIKQLRTDLQSAFPDMAPADVEKGVLTMKGITPKGASKEMQPDFKDGMLVGVKDPATNSYYTDPEKMPAEAKAIYDSAKKVEKEHQELQDARDDKRFRHQIEASTIAFQHALDRADYTAAQKEVKKAKSDYDGAIDRQQTMHQNLDAGLKGDQQAMLSLVANHIGMTLGAQKGARITRAVWDEATMSAPWLARVKARWSSDGYLSGVTLTPDQMHQMVDLGDQKVGILKDHVDRVSEEYADELGAKRRKTVTPPPSSKSSQKIKVTAEDMANAGR